MLGGTKRTRSSRSMAGAAPSASPGSFFTAIDPRIALAAYALLVTCVVAIALPALATAEQASAPTSSTAGDLDAGAYHTCAILDNGSVRCWGYSGEGQLGYGNRDTVGDDETPASVGPVYLGPGRTATAVSVGDYHTCAILDDRSVRCWGYGRAGRLGYGNTSNVGDKQTPASAGPVDLGSGRTAKAISAGGAHTCAILDNGSVLCWGFGGQGQLGYGNTSNVGDQQTPGSVGPVDLGPGRTAKAISAGAAHTCAILDNDSVLCWGFGGFGQLGYGSRDNVGDKRTPASVGPVDLGPGRTAVAISAGGAHTCAVLDDGSVRCWGYGGLGQLGYGNTNNVGAVDTPATAGPVNIGAGRTASAIAAGQIHTCALLDNRTVRCWGFGNNGRLGYGNTTSIGDLQTPDTAGPVDLGRGRTAVAISAGQSHTCARLDNRRVTCWGDGANGRLGYCSETDVGAKQAPGSVGTVNLEPGDGGVGCKPATGSVDPLVLQARRESALRSCLAQAARRPQRARGLARRDCLRRYARTPGRIVALHARAVSRNRVVLLFDAAGTDGNRPPAARSYLVKQS
ncbi:MAG: RCC1 domain-containing protein, partial [Solirubrobacteraceae bacterium]